MWRLDRHSIPLFRFRQARIKSAPSRRCRPAGGHGQVAQLSRVRERKSFTYAVHQGVHREACGGDLFRPNVRYLLASFAVAGPKIPIMREEWAVLRKVLTNC